MMTGDGLLSCGVGQRLSGVLIRGELAIGAQLRAAKLVCGRAVWMLTLIKSFASAEKLRAAAPFSPSVLVPRQQPVPATSDRRPAVPVVDASSERRASKEMILQRFVSLPDAGARRPMARQW